MINQNRSNKDMLAVRAINQYRHRDVLPYLGLRYYLENCSARRDRWAREVATHLFVSRRGPAYFHALHFKDCPEGETVVHRDMHFPGPNEILAETALLDECSKHPEAFNSLPIVFSYRLAGGSDHDGLFKHYFHGLKERQKAVAAACREVGNGVVLYTDIKKFYPSIPFDRLKKSWVKACDSSKINKYFREIGEKILSDHQLISKESEKSKGLLTGPMFSHLAGNLVLHEIDIAMNDKMKNCYFRYVDDIILVGTEKQVNSGRELLVERMSELELTLHDQDKDFSVSSKDWMKGEADFKDDNNQPNWMTFIGGLKFCLVSEPKSRIKLSKMFESEGFRIPLLDYSCVVKESSYSSKILNCISWVRRKKKSVSELIQDAIQLRKKTVNQFTLLMSDIHGLTGYDRKRMIPKLRYLSGRLAFLGRLDTLAEFSENLRPIKELYFHSAILSSISSRNVSNILPLGINVAQSAAQILRLSSEPVTCKISKINTVERQGLAIMKINGVNVDLCDSTGYQHDEINRFADWSDGMMNYDDLFIKEIACLHGKTNECRHRSVLGTAFDVDEQLTFDVISQLNQLSDY